MTGELLEEECVELFKSIRDNGRPREVALKFMRTKEQLQREVENRKLSFDSELVVCINHACIRVHHKAFAAAPMSFGNHGDAAALADCTPLTDWSLEGCSRPRWPTRLPERVAANFSIESVKRERVVSRDESTVFHQKRANSAERL